MDSSFGNEIVKTMSFFAILAFIGVLFCGILIGGCSYKCYEWYKTYDIKIEKVEK